MTDTTVKPFFGRDKLLREIVQGVLDTQPMDFALVAPKFCGKTRMLDLLVAEDGPLLDHDVAPWRQDKFQDNGRIIVLLIDCNWPRANENLLSFLAEQLATKLHAERPFDIEWKQVNSEESASRRLLLLAQAASREGFRIVLLLNNFDSIIVGKRLSQAQLNELRPLTTELALVIGSKQPLNDIDVEMTSSPLFNVLRPLYIGLLEQEAARAWIAAYQEDFPFLSDELLDPLLVITGRHPFLLARLRETLLEIQKMVPGDQPLEMTDFPLIELRLAEHGRLLFESLAKALKSPPQRIPANAVDKLLKLIIDAPIAPQAMDPEINPALNWFINQATVLYEDGMYRLFTPLFANFLRHQTGDGAPARQALPVVESAPIDSFAHLPRIERDLLLYLRENSDRVVSPQELLEEVWKLPASTSERRVQEAIRRLRNHLKEEQPPLGFIDNERGEGYRFIPE
ncbi:MAG: winged helix-turn-helix transcriptional regulator [Anaerolineales bacterium]|nr:winged helix-turn-helix transcriptional regulator [Anaerolineales bacterium]